MFLFDFHSHLTALTFEYGGIDWDSIFEEIIYSVFVLHQANLGLKFKMRFLQLCIDLSLACLQN